MAVFIQATHSYISEVIAASPDTDYDVPLPIVPPLQRAPRALPLRVAAMFKILVSPFKITGVMIHGNGLRIC